MNKNNNKNKSKLYVLSKMFLNVESIYSIMYGGGGMKAQTRSWEGQEVTKPGQ